MGVKKGIISILSEYEIDIKHEGSVLRAFCPFHDDHGRPNFTVYEDTNSWYCWACKEGGDVTAFVAKMDNTTYAIAKRKVEGVDVDLQELQEKINGICIEDEPLEFNTDLNILVSHTVREFLRNNPSKVDAILPILRDLDVRFSHPISPTGVSQILTNLNQQLQKL
jgi:DNA primase